MQNFDVLRMSLAKSVADFWVILFDYLVDVQNWSVISNMWELTVAKYQCFSSFRLWILYGFMVICLHIILAYVTASRKPILWKWGQAWVQWSFYAILQLGHSRLSGGVMWDFEATSLCFNLPTDVHQVSSWIHASSSTNEGQCHLVLQVLLPVIAPHYECSLVWWLWTWCQRLYMCLQPCNIVFCALFAYWWHFRSWQHLNNNIWDMRFTCQMSKLESEAV